MNKPPPAASAPTPPPRPGYAAMLAQSSRVDRFQHDVRQDRRAMVKGAVMGVVGVGIIAAWKAAESGPEAGLWYLARFGTSYAMAVLVFAVCTLFLVEYGGVLLRVLVGLFGALAMGDLSQHVIHYALIPTVAWMVALAVFLGFAADLLDIELLEAAGLAFFVYLGKFILKFAVYDVYMT